MLHFAFFTKSPPLSPAQQAEILRRQASSVRSRFNSLETICESGSIVTKELLSSVKNWNLLAEDMLSFCSESTILLHKDIVVDLPANIKKLNKVTIYFTQLINCYQTHYAIYRLRNKIESVEPEGALQLKEDLDDLQKQVSKVQKKTQSKFFEELTKQLLTNYAPDPIALFTGLSSKVAGKLCKFTLLARKQWYIYGDVRQEGNHLATLKADIEALPHQDKNPHLDLFCSLLRTKTRQELAINNLKRVEEVANTTWIVARVVLLLPSFLPKLLVTSLEVATNNILFNGSGIVSILIADSLRKWITPDGLLMFAIHCVAMRSLCPHEYSWQGIQHKISLQGCLFSKKFFVIRAIANYSWGAVRFLTIRALFRRSIEDSSIHSFTEELSISCSALNKHISLLETKIQHLKLLDLQPSLQDGSDPLEELALALAGMDVDALPKEIHKFVMPWVKKEEDAEVHSKEIQSVSKQIPNDQKPHNPPSILPGKDTLHCKLQQLFLTDQKSFVEYIASTNTLPKSLPKSV